MNNIRQIVKKWLIPPGVVELAASVSRRIRGQADLPEPPPVAFLQNAALAGRHRGERCFILGAGSSVAQQDLKKLAGEFVISVSNTFVHPDYPLFRPRYHVLPHILSGHGGLYEREKFVTWLREMEEKTLDAEMFFHVGDKCMIEEAGLFNNRVIHWNEYVDWDGTCNFPIDLSCIPSIKSVSEFAITVALVLGFEKIYLLGFDHDWFNGPLVYFFDHNAQHALRPNESLIPQVDAEFQMRRHADIFRKYKCLNGFRHNIYNANANELTYVDTFPRVRYESLFESRD